MREWQITAGTNRANLPKGVISSKISFQISDLAQLAPVVKLVFQDQAAPQRLLVLMPANGTCLVPNKEMCSGT